MFFPFTTFHEQWTVLGEQWTSLGEQWTTPGEWWTAMIARQLGGVLRQVNYIYLRRGAVGKTTNYVHKRDETDRTVDNLSRSQITGSAADRPIG